MKKICFLLLFNFIFFSSFAQEDGLVSGIYAGVNKISLNTDLFESKGEFGYELGILVSEYLFPKGDLLYQLSISKYNMNIDGNYTSYVDGHPVIKNVTDKYSRFVINIGTYYNQYLFLSEKDTFISMLGGLKFSVGKKGWEWENSNEGASVYGVNYGYGINMDTLAALTYTNIYYGFGLVAGNKRIKCYLMYHSSLTNIFRGINLDDYNSRKKLVTDTSQGTVKMGILTLNLLYKF